MPGWCSGKMNTDSPRCFGTSQFVRARHRPQSENHAPVVHTFEPLRIHSSPSRTAVISAAGDVGAATRLGQQLHPQLLALEDRREVAELLFLGAELEEHRGARRERRRLDAERIGEARQLLLQRHLVRRREPLAAVLTREADTGEPGVEELPLQLAGCLDLGQFLLVGVPRTQVTRPDRTVCSPAGWRGSRPGHGHGIRRRTPARPPRSPRADRS